MREIERKREKERERLKKRDDDGSTEKINLDCPKMVCIFESFMLQGSLINNHHTQSTPHTHIHTNIHIHINIHTHSYLHTLVHRYTNTHTSGSGGLSE